MVYRMEFEKMFLVFVSGEEYYVIFLLVLSIINGNDVRKIWIFSEGIVICIMLCFLENIFGFFFWIYN